MKPVGNSVARVDAEMDTWIWEETWESFPGLVEAGPAEELCDLSLEEAASWSVHTWLLWMLLNS